MAIDKLINQSQGTDIIDALESIATNVGGITYGPETSSDKVVSMTGYQKASTAAAISQGDTLNEAVGKLEKKVDDNTTAINGKVAGPSSTTIGDIVTFGNATGTEIDDSGVAIVTTVDATKDTEVPTSKAMGTYVSGLGYATGVNSSTADNLVTFNNTDGKALKDSGIAVATSTTGVVASADNAVPTSKSVANYVSGQNYAVGAESSTANNLVTFNDATGKALKNSGVAIATSTTGITDADGYVPTSKAVKAYVDSTATGISRYMGTITATSGLSTSAKKGDFYIVSTAWTGVHVGDEIIAEKDNPAQTIDGTNWTLLHNEADTDTKVTQTETSTNASYEVIFAGSTGSSDKTEGVGKDAGMTYNPSTNALTVTGPISAGSFGGNGVKTNWTGTIDNTTVPGTKLVDDRLNTDETNILSVQDMVTANWTRSRNLFDYDRQGICTIYSGTGVTATKNYDGTLTLNGTASGTLIILLSEVDLSDLFANGLVISGCPGIGSLMLQQFASPYTNYAVDTGSGATISGKTAISRLLYYADSGTVLNNVVVKPMLCSAEDWAKTKEFQPYAKPNYDLTQLESEDRASLAEVVDSGAKNKLNCTSFTSATESRGITFTPLSDGTIKATGTNDGTGNSILLLKVASAHEFDNMIISGLPVTDSYAYFRIQRNASPWDGTNYKHDAQVGSFSYETLIYAMIDQGTALPSGGIIFKPMICTKAAFGVSKTFVPFKYPYAPVLFKQVKHTFTTSDWERISELDFVVPNGYAAQITVGTQWRVGKATGVRIANSTTTFDNSHIIAQTDDSNGQLNISATGMAYAENNNVSLYVYAKHTVTAASDNFVNLCVIFSPTTL